MGKRQIDTILNTYVTRVKKTFDPDRIILYGSFARNEANEWSDIDIIVLSDFHEINQEIIDRKLYMMHKDLIVDHDFHVQGMKIQEYDQADPLSIISDIKKEGITLYQKPI
jgi:predicted nucleotidyltransferase